MNKVYRAYIIFLATIVIVLGIVFMSSSAQALSFDLDYEFSGADSPAGIAPWLNATFTDNGAGTVTLVMSDANLTDNEFVSGWYFNLDPVLLPSNLTFTYTGGVATVVSTTDDNIVSNSGNNAIFKADGDGYFDIRFDWGNKVFGVGDTSVYDITSICGACLDQFSFDFMSLPGGGNGSYNTAAHVQGIGLNDEGSGWIGNTVIPEPSTYLLLGSGLAGLVILRRKYYKSSS